MAEEKEYRAKTGWVENPLTGSPFVRVQQGGVKDLNGVVEQAREVEGWVEENGRPAHVASGTKLTRKGNG